MLKKLTAVAIFGGIRYERDLDPQRHLNIPNFNIFPAKCIPADYRLWAHRFTKPINRGG